MFYGYDTWIKFALKKHKSFIAHFLNVLVIVSSFNTEILLMLTDHIIPLKRNTVKMAGGEGDIYG